MNSTRLVRVLLILTALLCSAQPAEADDRPTIPGQFSVSPSGSATYILPIQISPGAGGTAPAVALLYDSQTLTSPLGAGWTISGYSMITRGPRTLSQDGVIAGPVMTGSDALYLDGQRLVQVSQTGTGAAKVTEYRKESDDVSRIVQTGDDLSNATFRVQTKGGMTVIFDGSRNSRVLLTDGSTLMMLQSSAEDSTGNYFDYFYDAGAKGDYVLKEIQYTGNWTRDVAGNIVDRKPFASILFEYGPAPRFIPFYVAGRAVERAKRLVAITSRVATSRITTAAPTWQRFRRYAFDYEDRPSFARYVLTAVHQFGRTDADELTPTRFAYSPGKTSWTAAANALPAIVLAKTEALAKGYRLAKVSGTGSAVPDLLFSAIIDGQLERFTFLNDGQGAWAKNDDLSIIPFAFATSDGLDLGAEVLDLDNDGKADLLQSSVRDGATAKSAYRVNAGKWTSASGYELPFVISENGKRTATVLPAKFSGTQFPDLLYHAASGDGFLTNDGTKWTPGPALPVSIAGGAVAINVDCSGPDEVLVRDGAGAFRVFRLQAGSWSELAGTSVPAIPAGTPFEAVRAVELNQDNCTDIVVALGTGPHIAWAAGSGGWTPSAKVPSFDLVDAAGDSADARFVDLDNDGLIDIIANRKVSDAKTIAFAYLQSSTGWDVAPAAFIPQQPLTSAQGGGFLQEINGDGFPDALFPTGGRMAFGAVLKGSATGFQDADSYAPAVAFARLDRQDRGVRFVDLDGNGLTDVLFNRKGQPDALNVPLSGAFLNTAAGWNSAPGLAPPLPLAGDDINGDPARFVDADGDGYLDLLYAYRRNDGSEDRKFFHNERDPAGGRRFVEVAGSPYIPPAAILFSTQKAGDQGTQIVDLNGDGRPDLIAARLKAKSELPAGTMVEICNTLAGQQVCRWNPQLVDSAAFLNSGQGWVRTTGLDAPTGFVASGTGQTEALFVQLADLNGDGLPDLVARFMHPWDANKEVSVAWRNTGRDWVEALALKSPVLLDAPRRSAKALAQWMDLNADGLPDILYSDRNGAVNSSKSWLGTGAGFVAAAAFDIPLEAMADRGGDPSYRLIDANGDGLADIVYARRESDGTVTRGYFKNTGSAWLPADAVDVASLPPVVDDRGQDLGVRLFDINGDGLLDVVRSYASGGSGAVVEQQALTNTGRRSEMLEAVDAGHNLRTRIYYQSLQEPSGERALAGQPAGPWQKVYVTPGEPVARPFVSPTPVTYVVRRTISRNGGTFDVGMDYRYGEYLLDADAMRTVGFGWREAFNEKTRILSRTEFARDSRQTGKTVREANCLIPAAATIDAANGCPANTSRRLTEVVNVWQTAEQDVGAIGGAPGKVRQTSLKETSSISWELDGTRVLREETSFVYDEPGTVLGRRLEVQSTTTSRADGTSLNVSNTYGANDAGRWLFGRLTEVTTTKIGDVSPGSTQRQREIRKTAFTYDPETGLLLTETVDPDVAAFTVTKTYTRDAYGNVISTVTTGTGLRREVNTPFDDLGRFQSKVSRITSTRTYATSSTYDRLSGAVLTTTDEDNHLASTFTYDRFERPATSVGPNGLVTRTDYLMPTEVDARFVSGIPAVTIVRTTVGARPSTYLVFDGAGRQLRSAGQGFTANPSVDRPILQDAEYDDLGRLTRQSLPYEIGTTRIWSAIAYDALDRRIRAVAPDGTIIHKTYAGRGSGGRRVTVTDATGKTSSSDYGARGQLLASIDAMGNKVELGYDAADRLNLVTGPTGAKTRTTYDHGRKTRVIDPDAGSWSYQYDAFGQLVRQTDGNNATLAMTYDELGRPLTKSGGDVSVSWEYDKAANGVGQVSKMIDTDRYEKTYVYDTYGRLSSETAKIAGEAFTTAYTYDDPYGTIAKVSMPGAPGGTPFTVLNRYDAKGAQYRVTDEQGAPLWEATETNALGEFVVERYGTAMTVRHTFDPNTGRIKRTRAKSDSGDDILELSLDYDAGGNVSRRQEAVRSVDERFSYDNLHRLTGISGTTGNANYVFDGAGRFTSKTGVGNYEYRSNATGTWAPANAVMRTRSGARVRNYLYDGNGNLKSAGSRQFKYDSAGRLVEIADGSAKTTFDYDPNGVRYRQIHVSGGKRIETIYVGAYERITETVAGSNESNIRSRYAIASPGGVFAIVQVVARRTAGGLAVEPKMVWYVHRDNLGSVVRVTDEDGRLAIRAWYDPWGKQISYVVLPAGNAFAGTLARGFTGQESIFNGEFIHMNGRVYDPETGMFIMADPIGNDVTDPSALGRFTYANDNPLSFTDPTGYFNLGRAFGGAVVGFFTGGPGGAVAGFLIAGNDKVNQWIEQNWREIVIVAAAATVTVLTAGTSCAITCTIIAGAAGGATAGGLSAALYGGDFSDVLEGAAKGAFWGGVSAAGMGLAGASTGFGSVVAHGAVGGAVTQGQGGNFWQGFLSASVARASSVYIPSSSSNAVNVARAAAVGGTTSSLSGGKFANGAMAGAMSQAIAYASRRFGGAQEQQGRGGNVAFVGGAADEYVGQNVEDEYKAYIAAHPDERVAYFSWDQSEDLADWINNSDGDVYVFAHSYGADTAAALVGNGVQVKLLITVDPVSRFGVGTPFGPSYQNVAKHAGQWINVYSASQQSTVPNLIRDAGGAWGASPGSIPTRIIPANDNHEAFRSMLQQARGN